MVVRVKIDLAEPLLTEEAKEELDEIHRAPIDPEGRDLKNVYNIIKENQMVEILNENAFGNVFGMYERLKKKEVEFFNKKL